MLHSEIHKLTNSVWNEEELPQQWKEAISVPIYNKNDKTDCSNYTWISLLSTTYKILFNILVSRLTPHVDEIIGNHQCRFQCKTSTTDHIFCIRQILKKMQEYNGTIRKSFIDPEKAYDSVRGGVLYNILTESGICMTLVRLIKMCLNDTVKST